MWMSPQSHFKLCFNLAFGSVLIERAAKADYSGFISLWLELNLAQLGRFTVLGITDICAALDNGNLHQAPMFIHHK